jgi:hypothetical protein
MVVTHPRDLCGFAEVAEQADASVSKTDVRKDVRVRLPLSAPHSSNDQLRWHRYGVFPRGRLPMSCAEAQGCDERLALSGFMKLADIFPNLLNFNRAPQDSGTYQR